MAGRSDPRSGVEGEVVLRWQDLVLEWDRWMRQAVMRALQDLLEDMT